MDSYLTHSDVYPDTYQNTVYAVAPGVSSVMKQRIIKQPIKETVNCHASRNVKVCNLM
jgi:hypothetical protein